MPTRTAPLDAAMVDDDDEAAETDADGVGGADIARHVFGLVLAAVEAAIERVDDDNCGHLAYLRLDVVDQRLMIGDEIDRHVDQIERDGSIVIDKMALPPGFLAGGKSRSTFKRKIDDRALLHLAPAIRPAECDMHHEIESPKALAA